MTPPDTLLVIPSYRDSLRLAAFLVASTQSPLQIALALTLLAPVLLIVFPLPSEGGLIPSGSDFVLLLVLSLGCTLLPFALSLVALRQMSAFSVQMAVNLEPVYSIVLAMVIFHEQRELNLGFYGGVAILLTAVFAQPWLKRST